MKKILLLIAVLQITTLNAQDITRRKGQAARTEGVIKIDGIDNESEWQRAPVMTDLIQQEPEPSKPARLKTEARILYDDRAIYVFATMHDPHPDSITKELTLRDEFGNTEIFCVIFDTYSDGNNAFNFCVQSSGVQCDARVYPNTSIDDDGDGGEDWSWSAVWNSAVKITDKGWTAELEIPFSALRFPNLPNQSWRFNFGRHLRRYRETSFWNEVNPNIEGFVNQCGVLDSINNIKSPVRIQAMPFVAAYALNDYNKNTNPKSIWRRSLSAGMDIKYGINDAFTLDMTLIPDFGQVRSDNKILNLSPFEVRFDENRAFFTEGVELFSKGDFFYTRRVGSIAPTFYDELETRLKTGETIVSTPTEAQLYNASKVSGRTSKGLGIGVFNATAAPTYATIENTEGVQRDEKLSPLTNYSVVSFDQNLPNNSFITLINTNVMRSGKAYDANLTGTVFNFRDKKNNYSVRGSAALVQRVFSEKNEVSHKYNFTAGKVSGTWRYELGHTKESYNYNPNDLGFLRSPNNVGWWLWGGHFKYNTKRFNEWQVSGFTYAATLHRPRVYSDYVINTESFFLTKKIFAFGFNARFEPLRTHDYFEPRTADFSRYYRWPRNYRLGGFISTDYRKMLATDFGVDYRWFQERGQNELQVRVQPRIRFNDRIAVLWEINTTHQINYPNFVRKNEQSIGYNQLPADAIILGERRQWEIVNIPTLKWNFNHLMGMNIRIRHYWSEVQYVRYYELGKKGELNPTTYKGEKSDNANSSLHNTNFNLFNVDANFTWRFAPGSDIIVNWKNNIFGENADVYRNYFFNARNLFDNPMNNSFSIRVIYFLDYLNFIKKKPVNN
jgi:hypothetical protein